jgi:MFS family permease
MALGLGAVFVGVQTAANTGVPPDKAGLAAALITASSTLGGALGLAIFTAIAAGRTRHLLATGTPPPAALTAGFHIALTACSVFLAAAALIAARTTRTRHQPTASHEQQPEPEPLREAA